LLQKKCTERPNGKKLLGEQIAARESWYFSIFAAASSALMWRIVLALIRRDWSRLCERWKSEWKSSSFQRAKRIKSTERRERERVEIGTRGRKLLIGYGRNSKVVCLRGGTGDDVHADERRKAERGIFESFLGGKWKCGLFPW
jgi:hypothetical protein